MKWALELPRQVGRTISYRLALLGRWTDIRLTRSSDWIAGKYLKWFISDRICKEEGCGRNLFVWHNGKHCTRHSRSHREHTVLVVTVPPKDERLQ